MKYPVRVINNRIKKNYTPALIIDRGEFSVEDHEPKDFFHNKSLLAKVVIAVLVLLIALESYFLIANPIMSVLSRERTILESMGDIKPLDKSRTLSVLLKESNIDIIHESEFGETQTIVTVGADVPLETLLPILSKVPGVFSFQYSQDGFQIFLAEGSL